MLGFSLVAPIFPLYILDLGASYTLLGAVISIYGAVQLLSQVPAGRLSDRVGRKPLLLAGLLTFTVMPLFYILARDPYTLLAIRALGGIGASMVWPVAMALAIDQAPKSGRGAAMGWYNAAFYSALAVGPAIGGALYNLMGLEAPFLCWAVLAVISVIMVVATVKEPTRSRSSSISIQPSRGKKERLVDPGYMSTFLACCGVVMGAGIMGSFNFTLLPSLGEEAGLTILEVGILYLAFGSSNAVCNVYFGNQADRGQRRILVLAGCLMATIAFGLFQYAHSTLPLMGVLLTLGIGSGMATPAATAMVADITSSSRRGEIFGIFNTARMAGVVLGPLIAGIAADAHGLSGALKIFVGITLLITVSTLYIREPPR